MCVTMMMIRGHSYATITANVFVVTGRGLDMHQPLLGLYAAAINTYNKNCLYLQCYLEYLSPLIVEAFFK